MALGWLAAGRNSWNGLRRTVREERSARQEAVAIVLAVPLAILVADGARHALLLIGLVVLALAVELLNSAIETLADRITREHDEAIGRAKDAGSAAVTLVIVVGAAFWIEALIGLAAETVGDMAGQAS